MFVIFLFPSGASLDDLLPEDEDISPDSDHNLLLHTDDQNFDAHFEHLQPPVNEEDYMFSLEQGEGIGDLFDDVVESFIKSPVMS